MSRFSRLSDWLDWQQTLHPRRIEPGLERVNRVARRMGLNRLSSTVISVAGTNGKGSSVAMLDHIYRAAGYRTATYTSPHLVRYNERIRIDGEEVGDDALCHAFEQVDAARGDTALTFFEFGTLAAFYLIERAQPDIAILEIGMGGRLDAVNSVDADVALVTRIDLDHGEWLGGDRESIGREKAGIFRPGHPAICSDPQPPASLRKTALETGALWRAPGEGFDYRLAAGGWCWTGKSVKPGPLPGPALPGKHQLHNAAGVLAVIEALQEDWPVTQQAMAEGLLGVKLPGRCQILPGEVEHVLDVAHNPAAAASLASTLRDLSPARQTWLVLGMLEDKDAAGFADALGGIVDVWCLAGLQVERGVGAQQLQKRLQAVTEGCRTLVFDTVGDAMHKLRQVAAPGDRIVVCGSFYSVAEARESMS